MGFLFSLSRLKIEIWPYNTRVTNKENTIMSERHEGETLQEYHDRLKQSKRTTKARLRGLLVHDSRNQGMHVAPKVAR